MTEHIRTDGPPRVAIYLRGLAASRELIHLARAMRRDGRIIPLLVLSSAELVQQLTPEALEEFETHLTYSAPQRPQVDPAAASAASGKVISTLGKHDRPVSTKRYIANAMTRIGLGEVVAFIGTFLDIRSGRELGRRVIEGRGAGALVVADDRSLAATPGLVAAFARQRLPTLSVPFAISDPEADVANRKGRVKYVLGGWSPGGLANAVASCLWPEQRRDASYGRVMFLSAGECLALAIAGLRMRQPWTYGGGLTEYAGVFGEIDLRHCLKRGVPSQKLFVCGQPSMDAMVGATRDRDQIRENLFARYGFPPRSRLIVLALPHYAEHGLISWDQHRRDTDALLRALRIDGASMLVSLHPRSKPQDYRGVLDAATLAEEPLGDALPAADLFIAGNSSTVRWSSLLRAPTIVLDDFGIAKAQYAGYEGLVFCDDRTRLTDLAWRLLSDSEERARVIRSLDLSARTLDPFDGRSATRVIDFLLDRMAGDAQEEPRSTADMHGNSLMKSR